MTAFFNPQEVAMPQLFRIENPNSDLGLWYDAEGQFRPVVTNLSDGKARNLPMGFDPDFGADGVRWYSACETIEALACVVSHQDVIELEAMGYGLYRYSVDIFRTNDWHALFALRNVLNVSKVDIGLLKAALAVEEMAA